MSATAKQLDPATVTLSDLKQKEQENWARKLEDLNSYSDEELSEIQQKVLAIQARRIQARQQDARRRAVEALREGQRKHRQILEEAGITERPRRRRVTTPTEPVSG